MTFRCGHPKTPENSTSGVRPYRGGKFYPQCALCKRTKEITYRVQRDQERINAGLPVDGRISAANAWL